MLNKILILLAVVCCFNTAFAQKKNLTDAYFALDHGELDKAKEYIEAASVEPTTMNMPKTWAYRANIYFAIFRDTARTPAHQEGDLNESFKSLKRLTELDPKGTFGLDVFNTIIPMYDIYNLSGSKNYDDHDYQSAYDNFGKVLELSKMVNQLFNQTNVDTFTTLYYAHAAFKLGKKEEAYKLYDVLRNERKYDDPLIYQDFADEAAQSKDTLKAISILDDGLGKFPKSESMMYQQLNYYIFSHHPGDAIGKLKKAIDMDPTRADLYRALGDAYKNTDDTANARKTYEQALKLDPKNFDIYKSLAEVYYNNAVKTIDEMNSLPDGDKRIDILKASSDALLYKALPYLEKAKELDSTDMEVLNALKEIYARTNQMEKVKEINADIQKQKGN